MAYLSKEAKRLAQMKFTEKEPMLIFTSPQTKTWTQYWSSIDRNDLQTILEIKDFQYMTSDEESIVVYFSKNETEEECQQRIAKQRAELDAYERRKRLFMLTFKSELMRLKKLKNFAVNDLVILNTLSYCV